MLCCFNRVLVLGKRRKKKLCRRLQHNRSLFGEADTVEKQGGWKKERKEN